MSSVAERAQAVINAYAAEQAKDNCQVDVGWMADYVCKQLHKLFRPSPEAMPLDVVVEVAIKDLSYNVSIRRGAGPYGSSDFVVFTNVEKNVCVSYMM